MLILNRSIATRLAVSSLLWSAVVLVDAAAFLYHLYQQSTEQTFDRRLVGYANSVAASLALVKEKGSTFEIIGGVEFEFPFSGWYWEALESEGTETHQFVSNSLLGERLTIPKEWSEYDRESSQSIRWGYGYAPDGLRVRMIERTAKFDDGRFYYIRVAGPASEIDDITSRFLYILVGTFSLLAVGWIITTFVQIRYGLQPLEELQRALSAVREGKKDRVSGNYPKDIAPIADELNLLLDTNKEIIDRARTQVGNLAHALKTPLSVIMNEAEVGNPKLADKVLEQAKVMRAQVDTHLNRARAAALVGTLGAKTSVNNVVEALSRTFQKIYCERNLKITTDVPKNTIFLGEEQDLQEILGNLMDNSCKWSHSQVHMNVSTSNESGRRRIKIAIDDDGPGIQNEDITTAIQRGKRLDETQPGTGLGLSIVADLTALYRGNVSFEASPLGGLRVILDLPGGTNNTEKTKN